MLDKEASPAVNLILLFGPPAVGKMTVGQELAELTGYRLLHNHMTIDLALAFFDFGTPDFNRLVPDLRRTIVRAAAKSDLAGLIFTFVWNFEAPEDQAFLDELRAVNDQEGGQTLYAELQAPVDVRVARHDTENRRNHKPRLVGAVPAERLREFGSKVRESDAQFPYAERHVKIHNTHVPPDEAARIIARHFHLAPLVPANGHARACGALVKDGRIAMVRHVDPDRSYWTLPGGAIEPGEGAADAATREFYEETTLPVRAVRPLFDDGRTVCYLVEPIGDGLVDIALGFDPEQTDVDAVDRELQGVTWRPIEDDLREDGQVKRVLETLTDAELSTAMSVLPRPGA
jgi:8-oxo-dGTP pyrophosphatase MutT (NUDIX family)